MNNRKVIFYLIDGARPDTLLKLVNRGLLPNIKAHLIEKGSMVQGTTCFPSTTGPAYLPFLTGYFPGDHDITGIRWFDKAQYFSHNRWSRNAMRSYCGYEVKYFGDDMNPDMPSLFETYPKGYNIYNMVTKGVKEGNELVKADKTKLYFNAHFKHEHHPVDRRGHEELMKTLDRDFQFVFVVFPSIDWDSHTYHYEDERTIAAYKIVDDSLGEVVAKLKQQGEYDNTLIVMSSDHGLSATHTHFDVGQFFKDNNYRVLEYPQLLTIKPQVAVSISGNSFATVSFLDKKELYSKADLMAKYGDVLKKFIANPAIDFVLVRKNATDISVLNRDGEAEILIKGDKVGYRSITANPLGLPDTDELLDQQAAFDFTYDSDYPDALIQCQQLFLSKRTGDVVVSAAIGYDLRDFWEYPEHKGSHGSLHKEHLYVPILTNKKDLLAKPIRTTELYKIIRTHLDKTAV